MEHRALWRCGTRRDRRSCTQHDQLSFELAANGQSLIVDPGSYLYTANPRARNEFRSTKAHSTLSVGAAEQSRLREDYLFTLPEEACARCIRFEVDGPRAIFEGEHTGFHELEREVCHRRELRFDGQSSIVSITDTVMGAQGEELLWTFPLAPGEATAQASRALATFAGARLEIEAEGAILTVESGWLSPSYGVRIPAPVVRARRIAKSDHDVTRFRLIVSG
jgi:uncharacterized heparinase superfamily protein